MVTQMKIQIASDLHFECWGSDSKNIIEKLSKSKADVLILAGDIDSRKNIFSSLKLFSDLYEHVIYVSGNHEHYGTHIDQLRKTRDLVHTQIPNCHWLDNNEVTINNQKFIGCTLWFRNNSLNQLYEKNISDFGSILNFKEWVYVENENSIKYLSDNITDSSIVVTHHLPLEESVHWSYKNDNLNRFFLCDMSSVIQEKKPKYYIHGHTHCCFDYEYGNTRVIANPLGYPGEYKVDTIFDFEKVIKI